MKSLFRILLCQNDGAEVPPALTPVVETSARLVQSNVVSLFDQAVVSGANFFTTLILARACTQEELGVYSLAWMLVLFLAAAQCNLITVPYTVYCHRRSGCSAAEYAGSTLAHQLLASFLAMLCFLLLDVVLSFGLGPERLRPAAWVLLAAIPFLLLREYARRFAFAHLALATAVTVDVAAAVLQLGGLVTLWQSGLLSAATTYAAMGVACATASLCWWFLDRQPMRFSRNKLLPDWRLNWSFGRWALLSQATGLAFYMLPWMLAAVRGEAQTGELMACMTLVGLANPLVFGLNNLLMPRAARAFGRQGAHALLGVLHQTAVCMLIVLGGLCIGAYFAGEFLAGMVYGAEYADTGSLVTLLALATLAEAMGLVASAGLWAMDRPGTSIVGDGVQLVITLGVAAVLVTPMGAKGIAIAMVTGRAAGALVRWATLSLLLQRVNRLVPATSGRT